MAPALPRPCPTLCPFAPPLRCRPALSFETRLFFCTEDGPPGRRWPPTAEGPWPTTMGSWPRVY